MQHMMQFFMKRNTKSRDNTLSSGIAVLDWRETQKQQRVNNAIPNVWYILLMEFERDSIASHKYFNDYLRCRQKWAKRKVDHKFFIQFSSFFGRKKRESFKWEELWNFSSTKRRLKNNERKKWTQIFKWKFLSFSINLHFFQAAIKQN